MQTEPKQVALGLIALCFAAAVYAEQFAYPSAGQSAEQQKKDEQACREWAVAQTGHDPAKASTGNAKQHPRVLRGAARGALAGWTVGAISDGDRSDAAWTGAAMGGLRSGVRGNRQKRSAQQAQNQQIEQYLRARAACLEAKDYTVK